LLAADAWEAIEELVNRIAGLKIIEKRLNWDARTGEDGGAA
jgi:hypothetical protein